MSHRRFTRGRHSRTEDDGISREKCSILLDDRGLRPARSLYLGLQVQEFLTFPSVNLTPSFLVG